MDKVYKDIYETINSRIFKISAINYFSKYKRYGMEKGLEKDLDMSITTYKRYVYRYKHLLLKEYGIDITKLSEQKLNIKQILELELEID